MKKNWINVSLTDYYFCKANALVLSSVKTKDLLKVLKSEIMQVF